ncbi:uncharacterized protein DC041_0007751 [Schistosoma bovis]|uniref:Ig-like domain-containing protein n=1 Tax=Schistosoma bovis TaxID=6184 RepID=A0A430Q814_SCHBO|nr:uncharacterized protein DC041_0007751 [Schistosoma bovis]
MILSLLSLMIYGIIIIYSKPLDIESDTPLTISFNPSSNQVQLNQPLIIRCEVHSFNNKQLQVNNNNNINILNGYSYLFYEYTIPNLTETWLGLNHNNNNNTSMDKDNHHRNKIEGFS